MLMLTVELIHSQRQSDVPGTVPENRRKEAARPSCLRVEISALCVTKNDKFHCHESIGILEPFCFFKCHHQPVGLWQHCM
jgi:hypothetical protein